MAYIWGYILEIIPPIVGIFLFISLLIILIRSRGIPEILAGLLLSALFVFYYAYILAAWGAMLDEFLFSSFGFDLSLPKALGVYHRFILNIIPETKGILVGGRRILTAVVDPRYMYSSAPVLALFGGILVRVVVERYVKNERVQQLAREYWLFITSYLVAATMISSITHLNFIWMIVIPLVLLFFFSAGVFKVISDICKAIWHMLKLLRDYLKLGLKYLAFLGARIAQFLRKVVRIIVDFYNRYIVDPLHKLYQKLQEIRQRAEDTVDAWLDALAPDD